MFKWTKNRFLNSCPVAAFRPIDIESGILIVWWYMIPTYVINYIKKMHYLANCSFSIPIPSGITAPNRDRVVTAFATTTDNFDLGKFQAPFKNYLKVRVRHTG